MKKALAILLCLCTLLTVFAFAAFAEYPVEGRDEPSVETAVENTIGKHIPTGKPLSDAFFNMVDNFKKVTTTISDFFKNLKKNFEKIAEPFNHIEDWFKK